MALPENFAAGAASAPALLAPGRPALTHDGLRRLIADTVKRLNGLGIGRNDRVAIMLPNGPEMAAAFLAVAAGAATAPLNPAYREEELTFYLTDIGAKAILVGRDETGPSVTVAEKLGIAIFRLDIAEGAASGTFTIDGKPVGPAVSTGYAGPDDTPPLPPTPPPPPRPQPPPPTP